MHAIALVGDDAATNLLAATGRIAGVLVMAPVDEPPGGVAQRAHVSKKGLDTAKARRPKVLPDDWVRFFNWGTGRSAPDDVLQRVHLVESRTPLPTSSSRSCPCSGAPQIARTLGGIWLRRENRKPASPRTCLWCRKSHVASCPPPPGKPVTRITPDTDWPESRRDSWGLQQSYRVRVVPRNLSDKHSNPRAWESVTRRPRLRRLERAKRLAELTRRPPLERAPIPLFCPPLRPRWEPAAEHDRRVISTSPAPLRETRVPARAARGAFAEARRLIWNARHPRFAVAGSRKAFVAPEPAEQPTRTAHTVPSTRLAEIAKVEASARYRARFGATFDEALARRRAA